jgi:CubicO group peptidase (beta-lactamase class C family)
MKKIGYFFLLIILTFSVNGQPPNEEKIRAVENNLGGWVKIQNGAGWNILDRMAYYKVNGLSIAVIDNYKIEWVKEYGWADTAEKRKVTASTLFQAASVGKSIHAAGTMKLVENGRLDPDKDINTYLKRWKFPYDSISKRKKITTLHLLSNSAGLSVHGFDGYKWDHPLPNIIQILNGEPPSNSPPVRSVLEPGTKFLYSGGGYTISEMMVEDITGSMYADFIEKTVLKPIGMNQTYYHGGLTKEAKKNLATAYRFDGKPIGCKYHIYPENACGASLWSTPTDLAKFIIELQLSLDGKKNKLLNAETTRMLFTPYVSNFYGLGFFIEKKGDEKYFHHTGLNEGFVSDYYGSMKGGRGVVIMANTDFASNSDITEEIINSVASIYNWNGFYKPVVKTEVKIQDNVFNQYTGVYKFDGVDQTVKVYQQNGKPWFHDSSSPVPWLMHFTSDKDFFFHEIMFNNHVFSRDSAGNVDGFIIQANDGEFKVRKIQ